MANQKSLHLIKNILKELAKERPLFHSEADFQHAFAMKFMQISNPKQIRLERRFITENKKQFELDMFVQTKNSKIGIELKYPQHKYETTFNEETFILKSHNNPGGNRYSFLYDIYRLEQLKESKIINEGYAILLTNVSKFHLDVKEKGRLEKLHLSKGRTIKAGETIEFNKTSKSPITPIKFPPFTFSKTYSEFTWEVYDESNKFKYLIVEV